MWRDQQGVLRLCTHNDAEKYQRVLGTCPQKTCDWNVKREGFYYWIHNHLSTNLSFLHPSRPIRVHEYSKQANCFYHMLDPQLTMWTLKAFNSQGVIVFNTIMEQRRQNSEPTTMRTGHTWVIIFIGKKMGKVGLMDVFLRKVRGMLWAAVQEGLYLCIIMD